MSILITPENKIRSPKHCKQAIDYVKNPEKAIDASKSELHDTNTLKYISRDEKCYRTSTRLCSEENAATEFEAVRIAANKNDGILIQHYIQSFSPEENITPDEAHQMALELVDKIAVGYQVVISTHIDKQHIHNHILINNVSPITQMKFPDNKTTMREYRKINDEISRLHGKSVIENPENKYVSRAAKETAKRGVSYKADMCTAIDNALTKSNDLKGFIFQMNRQGYGIRTGKYITVIELDNNKHRCRTDTLAKQFGEQYTAKNIYQKLGEEYDALAYSKEDSNGTKQLNEEFPSQTESNYKKVIDSTVASGDKANKYFTHNKFKYAQHNRINNSIAHCETAALHHGVAGIHNPTGRRNIAHLIGLFTITFRLQELRKKIEYGVSFSAHDLKTQRLGNRYVVSRKDISKELRSSRFVGNIDYNSLYASAGEIICVEAPLDRIPRMLNAPILYNLEFAYNDICKVYFKEQDKGFVEAVLDVKISENKAYRRPFRDNRTIISDIKNRGEAVSWQYGISEKQAKQLNRSGVECAIYTAKNSKTYNIAYSALNEIVVGKILNPERRQTANVPYSVFKRYTAESGIRPAYMKITEEQFTRLIESDIDVFSSLFTADDGKYNFVYLPQDKTSIQDIIYQRHKTEKNIVNPISEKKENVKYITIGYEQYQALLEGKIKVEAVREKNTNLFIAAFDASDEAAVRKVLENLEKEIFDRGTDNAIIRKWQEKGTQYAWRRNVTNEQVKSLLNEGVELYYVKSGENYSVAYRKEDEKNVQNKLNIGSAPTL